MVNSSSYFIRWVPVVLLVLAALTPAVSVAGMRPEEVKLFEEHKAKAEMGDPEAQQSLGWCYFFGSGVPKNSAEGIKWWRRAAELGNATAQQNLGSAYQSGEFVEWSGLEAMKWFRMAAAQGLPVALHTLGGKYESGSGVIKDDCEAYAYYSLAGESLEFSRKSLAALEEKMTPEARARGKQRAQAIQSEIKLRNAAMPAGESVKGGFRRDKGDYLEPPSLDNSNPDRFLERMRQKHGELSDIDGKKFIFIDNRFPLCRTFRKGYYRIDNLSLRDKFEMLDIVIRMQKHVENLDEILKGPDDDESIKRGMLLMNKWADEGRDLEKRLRAILDVR